MHDPGKSSQRETVSDSQRPPPLFFLFFSPCLSIPHISRQNRYMSGELTKPRVTGKAAALRFAKAYPVVLMARTRTYN